ncbi:T9SS type A sorting domain-containing protein [bacterium]|nr:T9SS type A sorting domain-containing protein [bacterium]
MDRFIYITRNRLVLVMAINMTNRHGICNINTKAHVLKCSIVKTIVRGVIMNKIVRILAVLVVCACSAQLAAAAIKPGSYPPSRQKGKQIRNLDANAWLIKNCNFGPFVWPEGSSSGGFWNGPGYNYIYGGGPWIGAVDTLGNKNVAIGYYPASGSSEMGPANPYTWDWTNQATDPQARLYLSTDPNDLAEWPLRDAQNRPIVKSVQDGYCTYSDENPAFTYAGETRVGVRVRQWSYAWNYADNNDIVFFYTRAFNASGGSLQGVYIGPCFDADIGDESGAAGNDRTDIDIYRNLAIQFQTDPETGWPRVGQFGCRYFESPINNTGDTVFVVDLDPDHCRAVPPGFPLGMTAFRIFTIAIDPATDENRYYTMQGYNYTTMVMDAYDETGTATPGDKRFVMSSGPFNMAAGDSAATCVGLMCAWDRDGLLQVSDVAQEIYNNGFQLAMPPQPALLTAVAGDRAAYLSWTRNAETAPDPYYAAIDSESRWYTYFPGTYYAIGQHRVDTTQIEMLIIKTGTMTTDTIMRSAPNPPGGTDTLAMRYNQRALYRPYDFQGYLLYRAATQEALSDPAARTPVGTIVTGSSGARGYYYDRNDGLQIVLDLEWNIYQTPDTTYYLPKYDTVGTDRGLVCALVDTGLNNGQAYFYGLSAYDYQPNVYFTRKSPTTLASDPASCAAMVIPVAAAPGYVPPNIVIRVDGGCDARYGGALDHFQNLAVANPPAVPADSFKIIWQALGRKTAGGAGAIRYPFYSGKLYNSSGAYLDSVGIVPQYGYVGGDPYQSFNGTPHDQLAFGGIVFQPYVKVEPWTCRVDGDSLQIAETPGGQRAYSRDSCRTLLDATNSFNPLSAMWMWRGSDFEVRWRDTIVQVGGVDTAALTCTVWDRDNDVEVPFQGGLSKANMTLPGWCFNPAGSATTNTLPYIYNRTSVDNWAIFISGVTVYFRPTTNTSANRRMVWSMRPETGDVWTVNCAGCATPVLGNVTTFILTPEVTGVAGGPQWPAFSTMLSQNMPNPFSTATELAYQVSQPCRVQLRVYNIAGQLVKTLCDGQRGAGHHAVRWDGRNDAGQKLSAGVYLYRLQAGDRTMTKKLVLVK